MNPRPIKDTHQVQMYSRTFRHYIAPFNEGVTFDPDGTWEAGWYHVPYEVLCASLKLRDWQVLNTRAKRWRVKTIGFKLTNLIPFTNEKTTLAGAVVSKVAFNLMPYCEIYIDKQYQLPIVMDMGLPNKYMQQNSGKPEDTILKEYKFQMGVLTNADARKIDPTTKKANEPNMAYWCMAAAVQPMELMNSKELSLIHI